MPKRPLEPDGHAARHVRLRVGVAVFAIGMAATVTVSRWAAENADREESDRLEHNARALVESVRIALSRVESRVSAVSGFLRFFENVSQEELEQFVADFGPLEGLGGYGYAPLVNAEDVDDYVARVRESEPGYQVFGVDAEGNRRPVEPQPQYAPLEVFAPPEAFGVPPRGLDIMSEPIRRAAVQELIRTHATVVTPFLQMLGQPNADGFLIFSPVVGGDSTVQGVVTAPIDLSLLFESQIPNELHGMFTWVLTDLADLSTVGTALTAEQVVFEDLVTVGTRVWQVQVAAIHTPGTQGIFDSGFSLPIGVTGSMISALVVVLWLQRSQVSAERAHARADAVTKDRFLASVSHELRTPLTAVIGFLHEAIKPQGSGDTPSDEMLSIAYDQAQEMEHIVEDLLVVARLDEPLPVPDRCTFELSDQVAQVVRGLPEVVQSEIRCKGEALALADMARTRQIVRNLVGNAAKHGAPPIEISIQPGPVHVRLRVSDHGRGVSPQHHRKLFEPYAAFLEPRTARDSLGIGLWLSRRLARVMGGDLTYHHGENGPTFELTLPTGAPVGNRAHSPTSRIPEATPSRGPAVASTAGQEFARAGPSGRVRSQAPE